MSRREEPERWAEIDAVFSRVLERPAEKRPTYLAELRGIDEQLRAAVARLLRLHAESEAFLETPPVLSPGSLEELVGDLSGGAGAERDAEPAARSGERVGSWRIVAPLGRGGMATVYLVERADGVYEQTAALKLLRRGLDTSDIVRRFRAERQILSSLEHPNISRLLDGGATEDGRPFLVMERVEGVRITEWCDARGATVEQRLELFDEVARAVHHAHTRLVVHRDLKPSNILVTADARVKLLDFGIAKILDPDVDLASRIPTRSGRRVLTPEYASPEQVRGDAVTTATDVYQLGLLLHRLLTGARPGEARGATARLAGDPTPTPTAPSRLAGRVDPALATVRDCTPDRLARRLRGDLDAIVLAALEAEPEDRYASALAMAEDVERHLQGRPITARPAGRLYRARKFMTRHRWLAPVAIAAGAVLGLYIGTLLHHGNQLEAERNAARQEAQRAGRVRDVLVDVFRSADPWQDTDSRDGSEITVREALAVGTERVREELSDEPEMRAELLGAIGDIYLRLGLHGSAAPLLEEALDLHRRMSGGESRQVAKTQRRLASVLVTQLMGDSAESLLRQSLAVYERLDGPRDTTTLGVRLALGELLSSRGRFDEAGPLLLDAVARAETTPTIPSRLHARAHLSLVGFHTGRDHAGLEEAERAARRAVSILRAEGRDAEPQLATALKKLGNVLDLRGRVSEASAAYGEAVDIYRRTIGADHPETLSTRQLLAISLNGAGHVEEAEEIERDVLARRIELLGEDDMRVALSRHQLSILLSRKGDLEEAAELNRQVLDAYAGGGPDPSARRHPLGTRCRILLARDDPAAAEPLCAESVRLGRNVRRPGSSELEQAKCFWGEALLGLGRIDEAAPLIDEAIAVLGDARPPTPRAYVRQCMATAAALADARGDERAARHWRERRRTVPEYW